MTSNLRVVRSARCARALQFGSQFAVMGGCPFAEGKNVEARGEMLDSQQVLRLQVVVNVYRQEMNGYHVLYRTRAPASVLRELSTAVDTTGERWGRLPECYMPWRFRSARLLTRDQKAQGSTVALGLSMSM